MHLVRLGPALIATLMISGGPVEAQTTPAPGTAAKTPSTRVTSTAKTNVSVQRTAKSLNCSKQADAKGLHGAARKHFMSSCKKA